jgi:hypothetical protein
LESLNAHFFAYFAGFFDGEGSVCVSLGSKGSLQAKLSVSQVDRAPLDLLMDEYGGSISVSTASKGNRKRVYVWQVTKGSERFARDILPYTLVKTRQLELFVHVRENLLTHKARSTPEIREQRQRAARTMVELNRGTA